MSDARLALAIEEAGGLPAAGRVLVFRPGRDADLSMLPRAGAEVVTGFRPDFDHWQSAGWQTVRAPVDEPAAAAVLFLPRARAHWHALMHEAARLTRPGAPIWIDGQKADGVDTALRDLRARARVIVAVSKAHGRAIAIENPGAAAFAGWQAETTLAAPGFVTRPGVFSADGIDPGSALLAAHLPVELGKRGADLGAGWGWLAGQVLTRPGIGELHLVEAEADALDCARENITDDRARFHWDTAEGFTPDRKLDFIVTNPPFHQGRAADPALGLAFIEAARRLLSPGGRLWLVANRTLPYEAALARSFAAVEQLAAEGGFKVFEACRPHSRPGGAPEAAAPRARGPRLVRGPRPARRT